MGINSVYVAEDGNPGGTLRVFGCMSKAFSSDHKSFSFIFTFFFNVYLFLREKMSVSGGEADTESEAGSRL